MFASIADCLAQGYLSPTASSVEPSPAGIMGAPLGPPAFPHSFKKNHFLQTPLLFVSGLYLTFTACEGSSWNLRPSDRLLFAAKMDRRISHTDLVMIDAHTRTAHFPARSLVKTQPWRLRVGET